GGGNRRVEIGAWGTKNPPSGSLVPLSSIPDPRPAKTCQRPPQRSYWQARGFRDRPLAPLTFLLLKEPVMLRRYGIVALLLLVPGVVRAQDAPEQLLPATTQLYLRWDGIEAHRADYEKLALGQMLKGD